MVKKRQSRVAQRVTNVTLRDLVNNNHLETISRLTALETTLNGLPAKVEKLEAHRNWLAGGLAAIGTGLTIVLGFLGLRH